MRSPDGAGASSFGRSLWSSPCSGRSLMRQPGHSGLPALIALLVAVAICPAGERPRVDARFERIATLEWRLAFAVPGESPWSPRGDQLAVVRGDPTASTLAIFDPSRPRSAPREVFSMPGPQQFPVSWSPDGEWIACLSRLRTQDFLWAIRVADGSRHLAGVGDVWPFLWGSRHTVLGFRHTDGEEIVRFDLSSLTGDEPPDSLDRRSRLAFMRRPGADFGAVRLRLGPVHEITPLTALGRVLVLGTFPDRTRFLVKQLGGRGLIVDANGTVLSDVGERVYPQSTTANGRFVAGFHEVDDGYDILSAEVLLHDLVTRREIPVRDAPQSTGVECAPVGTWLALQTLREGLVVGRLEISGPAAPP